MFQTFCSSFDAQILGDDEGEEWFATASWPCITQFSTPVGQDHYFLGFFLVAPMEAKS